jgi:hypothetical protein
MRSIARLAACTTAATVLWAAPGLAATGDISTVAGTGVAGLFGDGGPATSAQLNLPRAVNPIPTGGFLITDRENNRVRRVWPDGIITTVAGSGPIGAANGGFSGDGGPAVEAQLNFIHDAAPTPEGGFLISDLKNQRVRYVSPAGTINTVAGSGPFGCFCEGGFSGDGGPASAARLANPHGLAVNSDGSYLIADTDNNRVRRVATDGTISTVAGSGPVGNGNGSFAGDGGPATSARLNRPFEVAPTPDGGFLIADTGNQVIRRVAPDGTITTVAGLPGSSGFSGDGGPATAGRLSAPHGIAALSDGGILIADKNNQRVRWVAPDGTISTVAGSGPTGDASGSYGGDGGLATQALLNRPKSVAATPDGFLIADESNDRIRFVDLSVTPTETLLALTLVKKRLSTRRRGPTRLRLRLSVDAVIRLEMLRHDKVVVTVLRQGGRGENTISLGRRLTGRLKPGPYRMVIDASSADGQHAQATASLTIRRRR